MNIPDLKPDRVYVVQVRSENRFNVGEWSEGFEFETSGKGENERHHPWNDFLHDLADEQY